MCACEDTYVCSQHTDTRDDPAYLDNVEDEELANDLMWQMSDLWAVSRGYHVV